MVLGSYFFKNRARTALRGNWQTALVITFFAGVFTTITSVLQALWVPDPVTYMSYGLVDQFYAELLTVTQSQWTALSIVSILSLLLTPALNLGLNFYFISLLNGKALGVQEGLFGRMRHWRRALWLYVQMGVRIFGWSLLLIVPGILAALRYSMAPYLLAQNPDMTAGEAIEESKRIMRDKKMSFFMLRLSFVGWSLLANIAQIFLMDINVVVALVAAQFMQLAISTYMIGSCASFYLAVATPEGMESATQAMRDRLRQMGMDDSAINQAGYGKKSDDDDAKDESGEGDDLE